MAAAGVVTRHPIELAGQKRVPQELDIFARPDGRVHLGQVGGFGGDVEHQVADGDFAFEVDVRKHVGHHHRSLHGLARTQVQQIDVGQSRLVSQITRNKYGQPFGMLRPRGAVSGQALQGFVFFDDLGVSRHDLCGFAVQRKRNLACPFGELFARRLDAAHDEFEMGVVVTLVFLDHQEIFLRVRSAVQTVGSVKHENLETGNAKFLDQHRNLFDVGAVHRRQVEPVIHMETALGELQHLGVERLVRATFVQVILTRAEVVEAGRHAAHRGCPALAHGVFGEG